MNIEPTQEQFLRIMRELGFSDAQIEANRNHNGRLFLAPGVVLGMIRGTGGKKIDIRTGGLAA